MRVTTKNWIWVLTFLGTFISVDASAQYNISYSRDVSIPVTEDSVVLKNPWAGGFNAPQFSEVDLNLDGIQDLFVFDRQSRTVKTFINGGTPNTVDYTHAPEYQDKFPLSEGFMVLVDYNCDNKADLITYESAGFVVYRNDSDTELKFTRVTAPTINVDIGTGLIPAFMTPGDLAAFEDIDNDGDLDILAFGGGQIGTGTMLVYYQNQSMDKHGHCDSLDFIINTECWGNFSESSFTNALFLDETCKGVTSGKNENQLHPGSSLLALDLDGDDDKEILIGDISFGNIVALTNDGDLLAAHMASPDTLFPVSDIPVNIPIFPTAFFIDVNNNGAKDLLVAPSTFEGSENFQNVWWYDNLGTTSTPTFQRVTDRFLGNEMIELGADAQPQFFDVDSDGLLDILAGNEGYFQNGGTYLSSLAYYRNIGTATDPAFGLISRDYANFSNLGLAGLHFTLGDLDNDGDPDIVLGDSEGDLHYLENESVGSGPAVFNVGSATVNFMGIDVGQYATPHLYDASGDGLLDLIVGERGGTLNYFENTGTLTSPTFSDNPTNDFFGGIDAQDFCCTGFSVPFVSDLLDTTQTPFLLVGQENGKVVIFSGLEGDLTANFTRVDAIEVTAGNLSPAVADINQNGRGEVIIGELAGGMNVWKKELDTPVGVATVVTQNTSIKLYPNPARENFFLQSESAMDATIVVYDLMGRELGEKIQKQLPAHQPVSISTTSLSPGIYLVRVASQDATTAFRLIRN